MSGKSRLRPAEIVVMAVAWVAVFAVMGALAGAGVSHAIVYGVYPTTVPLIVAGLAWAVIMAARANWRKVRHRARGCHRRRRGNIRWDRLARGQSPALAYASCSSAAPPPSRGSSGA